MESIYTELALYGRNNELARTDKVFSPISEVCNGTVSLVSGEQWKTHRIEDRSNIWQFSLIFLTNLVSQQYTDQSHPNAELYTLYCDTPDDS